MPNIEKKQKVVQEIQQKIEDATLVVFTDYRGLNVAEMTSLREKLRVPGVEFKVLKNTMTEFALKNIGHEDIIPSIFGPNAVLFSNEDPVGPVKTIYDFIKQYKKLEVKVGILEGQVVGPEKIKALADLPPREVYWVRLQVRCRLLLPAWYMSLMPILLVWCESLTRFASKKRPARAEVG